MKRKNLLPALIIATQSTLCASFVAAQPNVNEAPKAANPPNEVRAPVDEKQQMKEIFEKAAAEGARITAMTPVQQQQEMQKLSEQMMRSILANAGFNDLELQDELAQFMRDQKAARQSLRVVASLVYLATSKKSPQDKTRIVSDAEFDAAFKTYLAQVEKEKARYKAAEASLDQQIGWSRNPKLHAVLLLNGYIGDAGWFSGDTSILAASPSTDLQTVLDWNAGKDVFAANAALLNLPIPNPNAPNLNPAAQ